MIPPAIGCAGSLLVLGGARSGKSRFAEIWAAGHGHPCIYLATATAGDDAEMADRIAHHRARRGAGWTTVEEPRQLVDALRGRCTADTVVLVDCLTLWIANLMLAGADMAAAGRDLVTALPALPGRVVLVSNEVGLGIVPDNAMARAFRDLTGRLHQDVAAVVDAVVLMAAGLPMVLKAPD